MERVVELILDNLEIPQCITISPNIVNGQVMLSLLLIQLVKNVQFRKRRPCTV